MTGNAGRVSSQLLSQGASAVVSGQRAAMEWRSESRQLRQYACITCGEAQQTAGLYIYLTYYKAELRGEGGRRLNGGGES